MHSTLVLAGLFVSTVSAQAVVPEGVNPKSWQAAVKLVNGFRFDKANLDVRLFANKEQGHDPAAICFDDQNRLYVAERRIVYADKFNDPLDGPARGFETEHSRPNPQTTQNRRNRTCRKQLRTIRSRG